MGHVIMDEQHDETRRRMRGGNTVMEHFVSGLKGLGFGVLGGVTSVVKQSYEGASNDGMQVCKGRRMKWRTHVPDFSINLF